MMEQNVFAKLNSINVNGHTEQKNKLTYLSWVWAWAEVKKLYPDANYEVMKFNGLPYVFDPMLGYMVYTKVTIEGQTHEMWLPVMDGANKAMRAEPYKYKVKKYAYGRWTGEYDERVCEKATMFDVNTAIMRCLTKNLAMFGLGLYIYAGEDLPEVEKEETQKEEVQKQESVAQKQSNTVAMQQKGNKSGKENITEQNRNVISIEGESIDQNKVTALKSMIYTKGADWKAILRKYKCKTFSSMTFADWMDAMSVLEGMPDAVRTTAANV